MYQFAGAQGIVLCCAQGILFPPSINTNTKYRVVSSFDFFTKWSFPTYDSVQKVGEALSCIGRWVVRLINIKRIYLQPIELYVDKSNVVLQQ